MLESPVAAGEGAMTEKFIIQEQIIEDLPTELTFQFKAYPGGGGKMTVYGDGLPFGNRDIIFDKDGMECGGGTAMCQCPKKATFIKEVSKPNAG